MYARNPGYIYALGGDSGAGINSAAGFLAVLGQCPVTSNFLAAIPYISVNEVSTIAAAYAFAGFATDAAHVSSSGTALALIGIANAFSNAANIAALSTGRALATTPAGNGTVPQATINTLANVLASCVNSPGLASLTCSMLFSNAGSGTIAPTDTATAAINIAHQPGSNVSALFNLQTPAAPFQPDLVSAPSDFTIVLDFTGGGLSDATSIAIDSAGNAWITQFDEGYNSIIELSSTGVALSGLTGYAISADQSGPFAIAIDNSGNVWSANCHNSTVTELSASGNIKNTFAVSIEPNAIAVDGLDNIWVESSYSDSLNKLSSVGLLFTVSTGNGAVSNGPLSIAVDDSEDVWVADGGRNQIAKFSSTGSLLGGFGGGGLEDAAAVALDSFGNVWTVNYYDRVTEFSNLGVALSPSTGFTGGGLEHSQSIAIDGAGNAWITNQGNASLTELSNAGVAVSPSSGYGYRNGGIEFLPYSIAIDGSGNVWTANYGSSARAQVSEFIGAAVPVVTPIAAGVRNKALGTRP